MSCSTLDKTFRVFSSHKDDQSFEMSQRNVARRTKRIKLSDSSELRLSAVTDLAFCALRENDWCNVVTAHAGEPCAYTWRMGKATLGEFTLQPPLSELIHMQVSPRQWMRKKNDPSLSLLSLPSLSLSLSLCDVTFTERAL